MMQRLGYEYKIQNDSPKDTFLEIANDLLGFLTSHVVVQYSRDATTVFVCKKFITVNFSSVPLSVIF